MMLAFLIDQVQEATRGLFQKAMGHKKTRRAFWEAMRAFFYTYFVESWEDLLTAMGPGFKGAKLIIESG